MLAQAEVSLFAGAEAPSDELVKVAWYLHTVASSDPAFELYPVDRRLAAFQVAGHVFDLYVRARLSELAPADLLRLLFAGQVAYLRSDQHPNAMALARRVADAEAALLEAPGQASLLAGIRLLAFDRKRVFSTTRAWRDEANLIAELLDLDSPDETVFGPAIRVTAACRELMRYLTYSDAQNSLRRAQDLLRAAIGEPAPLIDIDSQWVAAQLLPIADGLAEASAWSVLPPDAPASAAQTMTVSDPPVLNLWPPQHEFFTTDPNPLDPQTRRVLLSLPTSAGKSLVAQFMAVIHLVSGQGGVCYIAPTRSLVREIRDALRSRLDPLPATVAEETGTWVEIAPDSNVEVMTPERLAHLVRSDLESVLDRFGLFIIDEAHLLDDQERGWSLESTLSTLNSFTLRSHHRIALLSSAIGNRVEVMSWIDPQDIGIRQHSDWRGPRRLDGIYETIIDWDSERIEPPVGRQRLGRAFYDMYGRLHLRVADGTVTRGTFQDPVGTAVRRIEPSGLVRQGLAQSETTTQRSRLVPLISHVAQAGPTLVVHSTKAEASRLAVEVADQEEEAPDAVLLSEQCAARLPGGHPLIPVLRKGVAFHHGALPEDVRALVEDGVREGVIRVLVTTTTLTEGVNLPVRSVIVASQGTSWAEEAFIVGSKLLNAIGRAGRAGKETDGWVILYANRGYDEALFDSLVRDDDELHIRSVLTRDEVLESLQQIEERIRASEDEIFDLADSTANDFASYIWQLCRLIERPDHQVDFGEVMRIIRHTLGWSQLNNAGRARWGSLVTIVHSQYQEAPSRSRARWASSTLSLGSSRRLERLAEEAVTWILANPDGALSSPLGALNALVRSGVFAALLDLREAEEVKRKVPRIRRNAPQSESVDVDVVELVRSWIEGEDYTSIGELHLSAISDAAYRSEALVEYLTALCENYLPWVLTHLVGWINEELALRDVDVELRPDLGLHIQWGVASATAIAMMRSGVRSRRAVNQIATAADAAGINPEDLRTWIGSMGVPELGQMFDLNRPEFDELLRYARVLTGKALQALLSQGQWTIFIDDVPEGQGGAAVELRRQAQGGYAVVDPVDRQEVGSVPTPWVEDVRLLIESGLPITAELNEPQDPDESERYTLTVTLAEI